MLVYDITFTAETESLKAELVKLKKEVDTIFSNPVAKGDSRLTQGKAAAQFLQQALQKATSVDGTSLARFNTELRKSGINAATLVKTLSNANMHQNLNTLISTLSSADTKLTVLNDHFKEMHRVMTQSIKFRAAMVIQDFLTEQGQAAIQWTKDFNQGLVDIQVVSEKTDKQMGGVFNNIIKKSKELKSTAKAYSQAALVFYQQGLPDDEVERRADITIKAARAAGDEAAVMSKNLTAIWNTYSMQGDRLQNAASIAARLGADTAVDFKYIAEAMQISASAASQMGLSYENLAAIIATVGETSMQGASIVGNAFKTIISRFDQLKASGTDGEVTLGRVSEQLKDLGISILDENENLKQMDQIIYETGEKWKGYSQKQQIAIAELIGGTRQYGQALSLFNNWDKFLLNANTALSETDSSTLEKQFATASQTIKVSADQAAEAWSKALGKISNEDTLKGLYAATKQLGDLVGTIIDALGGLPGMLTVIGVAFSRNILGKIGASAKELISFSGAARQWIGEKGKDSIGIVKQRREGKKIADTQSGADKSATERAFRPDVLRYNEQLNDVIRTGTALEKEDARVRLNNFQEHIKMANAAEKDLEKIKKETDQKRGSQQTKKLGSIVSEITPTIDDNKKAAVVKKLQTYFNGFPIKLKMLEDENFEEYLQRVSAELEKIRAKSVDAEPIDITSEDSNVQKARDNFTKAKEAEGKLEDNLIKLQQNKATYIQEEEMRTKEIAATKKQLVALEKELVKETKILAAAQAEAVKPKNVGPKLSDAEVAKNTAALRKKMRAPTIDPIVPEKPIKATKQLPTVAPIAPFIRDGELKVRKEALKAKEKEVASLEQKMRKLGTTKVSMDPEAMDKAIKGMENSLLVAQKKTNSRKNIFEKIETDAKSAIHTMDTASKLSKQMVSNLGEAGRAVEEYRLGNDSMMAALKKNEALTMPRLDFASSISGFAQVTTSVILFGQSLSALTDGEGNFLADLGQSLMMFTLSLPMFLAGGTEVISLFKTLDGVVKASIAAREMVIILNAAETVSEEQLAAAKLLGITATTNAATGETVYAAAKTQSAFASMVLAVANKAALTSMQALLLVSGLVVAGIAILVFGIMQLVKMFNANRDAAMANAKAMDAQNQKMNEAAASAANLKGEVNGLTSTLEQQITAGEDTTDTLGDLDKKLKSLRDSYRDLDVSSTTLKLIEQAEIIGKATGNWDEYYEKLKIADKEVNKKMGAIASQQMEAQMEAAKYAFAKGDGDLSGKREIGTKFKSNDKIVADLFSKYSEVIDVVAPGSDDGTMKLDFSGTPEKFVESYEKLQKLIFEMAEAGKTGNDAYREINLELEATAEYYKAIKEAIPNKEESTFTGIVDDLKTMYGEEILTEGSILTISHYREQLKLLTDRLELTGMAFEDAETKASAFLSNQGERTRVFGKQIAATEITLDQIARKSIMSISENGLINTVISNLTGATAKVKAETELVAANALKDIAERKVEAEKLLNAKPPTIMMPSAELAGFHEIEYATEATIELARATEEQAAAQLAATKATEDFNTAYEDLVSTQKAGFKDGVTKWFDNLNEEDLEAASAIQVSTIVDFNFKDIEKALDDALMDSKLDLKLKVPVSLDGKLNEGEEKNLEVDPATFSYFTEQMESTVKEAGQFQDIIEKVGNESKVISEASDAIGRIGEMSLTSATGLNDLKAAFEDYKEVLKDGDKDSVGYAKAMTTIHKAISEVLNINPNALNESFLTSAENLDLMKKAALGSAEALDQLRKLASEDILQQITFGMDTDKITGINALHDQLVGMQFPDIAIGARIDNTEFLNSAQEMVDAAGMTAEQARAYFGTMGYDVEVEQQAIKSTSQIPVYHTQTYKGEPTKVVIGADEDGNPITKSVDNTYTTTTVDRYVPLEETKMVTALKTHPTGVNKGKPIINKKATSSNVQGQTKGVRGGDTAGKKAKSGGKGSKPKKQDSLGKKNSENRLDYLKDLIGLYGKLEFYGEKEIKRLEKEAELQKSITKAAAARVPETRIERDNSMKALKGYGIKFSVDELGLSYITNLEEVVKKYGDTNEKLADAIEAYSKDEAEFIKAKEDLNDSQIAELDKMLQVALSINKQTIGFQERAITIAEAFQSSYIRGARILTDAGGNLFGEMSVLSDKMYSGAARLLNLYFDKDQAMVNNFKNNISEYAEMWEKVQSNNKYAASKGWDYAAEDKKGNKTMADRATLLEEMHNIQDGLISTLEDMYSHNEKVWSTFNDILSQWTDHLDVIYGKFENMKSVAESMLDIAKSTGTQMFTPEQRKTLLTIQKTQQVINKEQVASAKTRLDFEQANLNTQKAAVENFIANRDRTHASISDDEFARQLQSMNEMTKTMEENLQNATNEYWSAFKGSIEDAWDYYETYGEEVIYKMKHNLATGKGFDGSDAKGSYSFLGQMIDFKNEKLDRYMNPGSQVRQLTELSRSLGEFDLTKITDKEEYNDLMADILSAKKMEVELTEYDYQILVERFNLIKAQAAFEDARAAKNTMRLARDASGNWSYLYSNDKEDEDDKAKEIEDSLNKIYELSYDRVRSLVNELYGLPDELATALSKLDPKDPKYEGQAKKIEEYYKNRADYLSNQINQAELNSASVSSLVVKSKITDLEYLQSIQRLGKVTVESLYGAEAGWLFGSAEGNKHLKEVITDSISGPGGQIENWKNLQIQITASFTAAGQDINKFTSDWSLNAQKIGEDAQRVKKQFEDASMGATNAIQTMIRNEQEWAIDMARQAASIIASIQGIIAEIEKLEAAKLGLKVDPTTGNIFNKDVDYSKLIGEMVEQVNKERFKGGDSSAALKYIQNDPVLNAKLQQLVAQRDAKIDADPNLKEKYGENSSQELLDMIRDGGIGWDKAANSWVYWDPKQQKRVSLSYEEVRRWQDGWRPTALQTPGYNYKFNTGGLVPGKDSTKGDIVPAMLTPAEYVLNPEDTQAFFRAFNAFLSIPKYTTNIKTKDETSPLEQIIKIYADFPNVSSREEIRIALNNLINQAKQYNV